MYKLISQSNPPITDFQNNSFPIILHMNLNHISSDRRFFTFPAIHPCSTVSPAALLDDLYSLAADIDAAGSRQSEHFRTSRRAARDAIRFAAVLLAFLEDLLSGYPHSALPAVAILGLSDLHVTLQKLRFLLADCARRGARVWILMNADRVAGEFRVLLRSISPALEVLPLESMDVSEEVRDLILFLAGQARRFQASIELLDDLAARSVRSILAQFQSGESPDPSDLNRVLNHLSITSWSDCLAEVAFLEEEIFADEGDGDSALLWNLMGLMIYSMVVLIDTTPGGKRMKTEGFLPRQQPTTAIERVDFDRFRCPISLELMKDPVTVSTGQTYDRSSILRWLKSGNKTCPVTGEKLDGGILIPNSTVRKLVSVYCNEKGISTSQQGKTHKKDISRTQSPATPSAIGAIRMAATIMVGKLASGAPEMKNIAAYMIKTLSKSNNFNRICFVEAGAVHWLLSILSSSDHPLQENAVSALLNLSKHHSGRTDIFESAGLAPVVQIMKTSYKVEAQQNAAAILFYLCAMEKCREAIGDIPEAIPALTELLRNGTYRGRKNAIVTIYGLLLFPDNQPKILAADAVAVMSEILEVEEEDLVTDCVGVLAKIAESQDGANTILKSPAVVDQIVHVLQTSSCDSGREYCASALLALCKNGGGKAMSTLDRIPLLMPSLYSLLSEGSRHASKKARALLNHIHRHKDQAYFHTLPPPATNDPMVHAL